MTIISPGQGQSLLALLSGVGGQSAGGLMGLLELVRTGNAGKASERVRKTAEALAYTPTDPEAIAALQGAGNALGPVADALDAAGTWAGENTASATGSPLLGSLAKLAPDVIPIDRIVSVLARAARGAGRGVSPVLARMAGDGSASGGAVPTSEGIEVGVPTNRDMAAMRAAIDKRIADIKKEGANEWDEVRYDALKAEMESLTRQREATYDIEGVQPHPNLDMSDEAIAKRREEQGYIPIFHGTGENRALSRVDLAQAGSRSGGNSARLGFWASEEPQTANAYAAMRAASMGRRNSRDFADAAMSGEVDPPTVPSDVWELGDVAPAIQDSLGATGGVVYPMYARPGKTYTHDFGPEGGVYGGGLLSKVIQKAWDEGYDSVNFKNIMDDPASPLYQDMLLQDPDLADTMANHWVFKNPNQLRGRDAAFDPELINDDALNSFTKRQPNIMSALRGDARSAALNSIFSYLLAQRER